MNATSDPHPSLGNDWDPFLRAQAQERYWRCLQDCLEMERTCFAVYPPSEMVLEALRLTRRADTRLVIVGQDPYFRAGLAHGLAFSVPRGVKPPMSLRNILTELRDDGCPTTDLAKGNLEMWARRGVLLLNTTLTVREGVPGSHRGMGWELFTDRIIEELAQVSPVFMLWGKEAQRKKSLLLKMPAELIIESPHPRVPAFLGSKPFSRADKVFINSGKQPIAWCLGE